MPTFETEAIICSSINKPDSLKLAFSLLKEFAEICNRAHLDNVLVNGLILKGPIRIWDRYQVGEEYIRVVGSKLKVALLVKRYLIDLTMENVVVNRAGRFRVFYEMDPALKCLGCRAEYLC